MSLPRSTPSAQGIDAAGLRDFVVALERDGLDPHSIMVARHGHVVAQGWWSPYEPNRPALVYSLSKTVTATAIALLVQQGRLGLDDLVLDHFPEVDREAVAPRWSRVRVRHCLSMTVGHEVDAWGQVQSGPDSSRNGADGLVARVFATVPTAEPGTVFTYNQAATFLLAVIAQRVTGGGLPDVLGPPLLGALGQGDIPWHRDRQGHEIGFSGAHLTTEAVLTLGQLYLSRGRLGDEQHVDPAWFDEACVGFGPVPAAGGDPDWSRGYGYSLWMQRFGYRGDGAFGQFMVVLPEHDVVVAITAEHERMQLTLDLLWRHVVPALERSGSPEADAELAALLDSRAIEPVQAGAAGPDRAEFARSSGSDLAASYTGVTVVREGDGHRLELHRDGARMPLTVTSGAWTESTLVSDTASLPVMATGGWVDDRTFEAVVVLIETPHRFRVRADLAAGTADLTWRFVPLYGPDPLHIAVRRA